MSAEQYSREAAAAPVVRPVPGAQLRGKAA